MGNKKRKEQGSLEKVAQKKSKMVEAAAMGGKRCNSDGA